MQTTITRVIAVIFITVFFSVNLLNAATIELKTESGDDITAIYSSPESKEKLPVVIYNHGTLVRRLGYSEAAASGYDVQQFVKALNDDGFAAIAPIRNVGKLASVSRVQKKDIMGGSSTEWDKAVVQGREAISSALKFLKEQPNVDSERIGIIGFSEGGNITLWSSFEQKDFKAIVLMSPANLGKADEYQFSNALPFLEKISAPVLLTLGKKDLRIIIKNCKSEFIPEMKQLNKALEYRIDYPGNHDWFWKVRPEYWGHVIGFLNKHLK